jgi:hypothetical protein
MKCCTRRASIRIPRGNYASQEFPRAHEPRERRRITASVVPAQIEHVVEIVDGQVLTGAAGGGAHCVETACRYLGQVYSHGGISVANSCTNRDFPHRALMSRQGSLGSKSTR